MSARDNLGEAAERSAVYRAFAGVYVFRCGALGIRDIGTEYNDAFDPSVSETACSLREGAHVEDDQSYLFEELMRFYEFFGLGRAERAEMPDHLSVELEFMQFLTHLEAQALDRPDDIVSVRRAQADFLDRHLLRLLNGVQKKLDAGGEKCVALVGSCAEFVRSERMSLGNVPSHSG